MLPGALGSPHFAKEWNAIVGWSKTLNDLVQEEMRNRQVPLERYVITKTLAKPPEAYPDAKNQPHVAQRLKQQGHSSGCSVGDTIPYIICYEQGGSQAVQVTLLNVPDILMNLNENKGHD
ncbi:hypothetical protein JHK85_012595 [Glycine max]|nr:hypothetical protein JHK85_012595 [Glycine max]